MQPQFPQTTVLRLLPPAPRRTSSASPDSVLLAVCNPDVPKPDNRAVAGLLKVALCKTRPSLLRGCRAGPCSFPSRSPSYAAHVILAA